MTGTPQPSAPPAPDAEPMPAVEPCPGPPIPFPPSVEVLSIFMPNLDPAVPPAQARIVTHFLPPATRFYQFLTSRPHGAALDIWLAQTDADIVIILDIDCIPLTPDALPSLISLASRGHLAGCAQRASHLSNGDHLYASAFCMAVPVAHWRALGSPGFQPTERSDVAEELTWRWDSPPQLLYPIHVEEPRWSLTPSRVFGPGTTYGAFAGGDIPSLPSPAARAPAFYHAFETRDDPARFLRRAAEVLPDAP